MISVRPFKVIVAAVSCVVLLTQPATGISIGEEAPYFQVTSGDEEILTSDMLKGKVAVIFYETKDKIEKNRPLKEELNAFYAAQPPARQKEILRIAVIRCSVFFQNTWKQNLLEHSKKEGLTIYGDWDGSMASKYNMVSGESNFLIIDKSGIARYVRAGVIPKEDFPDIKKILNEL